MILFFVSVLCSWFGLGCDYEIPYMCTNPDMNYDLYYFCSGDAGYNDHYLLNLNGNVIAISWNVFNQLKYECYEQRGGQWENWDSVNGLTGRCTK